MNAIVAGLASLACSMRYMTTEVSGWWLFAAAALLVYAWCHAD